MLVDRARFEKFAKALIFLPMAISLVGASIIWKFVYDYRPARHDQIGLLNQILKQLGFDTYHFLLTEPWNTLFLIVILIWVQAGFAMTILSASIKAHPRGHRSRPPGSTASAALQMFRYITVPSIRPSLIVVLTTISIATLKVFDIVRTATGGNFDTSVLAYEFYGQSFRSVNQGLGAALAVLIFLLVTPDRHLQRPSDAQAGGPMTTPTTAPSPVEAAAAQPEPRRDRARKTADRSPWASATALVIAAAVDDPDHRPVHLVLPPGGRRSRPTAGGTSSADPSLHPRELQDGAARDRHRPGDLLRSTRSSSRSRRC